MKNQLLLSFALLILLLGSACGPDDEFCDDPGNIDCPNYDPCTLAVAANSDFKLLATVAFAADTTINIEVDSAYGGGYTIFQADIKEGLTYAWKIGADPRTFSDPEVFLNFADFTGDLSVTLETIALDSLGCLTASQMRDVKEKKVYFTDLSIPAPIHGVFKGRIAGEVSGQEYEVTVEKTTRLTRLHDLPLPGDCTFAGRGVPLYSGFQYFVSTFLQDNIRTPRCRDLIVIGRINLEDSNELRIDYVYDDDDGKRKEVVFVGRRQ